MSKVWYLLKIQLLGAFGINRMLHEKDAKEKKRVIGMAALFTVVGMMILGMSITYNAIILINLTAWKMKELYLPLMMMATSFILFMTTIYKASSILFEAKDYDMILALPIKTTHVVASRIIWLYSMNFFFLCMIMLPAGVLYGMAVKASLFFWIKYGISLFFIPLIPIIVGAIAGSIITAVASKFKHTHIVSIVLSIAAIVLIFLSTGVIGQGAETLLEDVEALGPMLEGFIGKVYPIALLYGKGVCNFDFISFLGFILSSLACFFVFVTLLGKKFKVIHTRMHTSCARQDYELGELKGNSPLMALYQKELRRYFSSTVYVVNTAVGCVLLLFVAISVCFFDHGRIESIFEIPHLMDYLGQMAPVMMAVFMILTCTTSSAVSIEGNNLWILKSLPIEVRQIFLSKMMVQLTITVPSIVIGGIFMIIGLQTNLWQSILIILLPLVYTIFIGVLGLIANLKYPKLEWKNEVEVVKQGMAVMMTMLYGMLSLAVPGGMLLVVPGISGEMKMGLLTLVMIVLTLLMYRYMNTRGIQRFKNLGE